MRFTICENRYTSKRVQWIDGSIRVVAIKKGMPADQKALVEKSHVAPELKLAQIEKMITSGKFDADALKAVLNAPVDFDALVNEVA